MRPIRHADKDFSAAMLPHSRVQAFFDIVKNEWRKMLLHGLFFLLGTAPILILLSLMIRGIALNLDAIESGAIGEAEGYRAIFSVMNYTSLFLIPAILFFAVVLSGLNRIYVKLCWQRGILYFSDFWLGIKQNSLQNIGFSIILSLLLPLATILHSFLFLNMKGSMPLAFIFYFLLLFVALPGLAVFLMMSAVYQSPFLLRMKAAFQLLVRGYLPIAGFLLLALAPLFLLLIGNTMVTVTTLLLYAFLYLPLWHLAFTLLLLKLFDTHINRFSYPELVDRGIWRP